MIHHFCICYSATLKTSTFLTSMHIIILCLIHGTIMKENDIYLSMLIRSLEKIITIIENKQTKAHTHKTNPEKHKEHKS